jgi:hypothetical protein
MRGFLQNDHREGRCFAPTLRCGLLIAGLALASTAYAAEGGRWPRWWRRGRRHPSHYGG